MWTWTKLKCKLFGHTWEVVMSGDEYAVRECTRCKEIQDVAEDHKWILSKPQRRQL